MNSVSVLKNSFFYSLAAALQGFITFCLLPIYTRFLTTQDYALVALISSFTGILSAVMTFQIHAAMPRFVIKFNNEPDRARSYVSSIFILLFFVLLFGCSTFNIFGEKIIKIMFSGKDNISYSPLFLIATWTLLPNILAGTAAGLLQTLEKGLQFLLVIIIQTIINVSFALYFVVFLKIGPLGIVLAQLISAICGLIIVIFLIRDWLKIMLPKFSQDIKDSLRYSLPIIPHVLSIYIYMYSDRLILQRYVPLSDIGIYSIADTFAYILLIIINAINLAYSPRFLKLAQEDKAKAQEETRSFMEIWWFAIMVIFLGYLLLSGYIVRLMTRPAFFPAIRLIPILALAYIFRGLYCFGANGIFFIEKTKYIPIITISAAVSNVVLNLIFIPRFGIFAAAWNTVFSYLITFILAYYFSKRYFPNIYPVRNMLNVALLLLACYGLAKVFNAAMPSDNLVKLYFNIIIFVLFIVSAFFIHFRNYLPLAGKVTYSIVGYLRKLNHLL